MNQLLDLAAIYQPYLTLILGTFVLALLLTPLTGPLAKWLKAIDQPPQARKRGDRTKHRRIHKVPMPNLGGIAVFLSFLAGIVFAANAGLIELGSQQLLAIILASTVIAAIGATDSAIDLSAGTQLIFQVGAAAIITLLGIKIEFIEIMQIYIDFSIIEFNFEALGLNLSIMPIADLITIIWIVGMINAMNWVSGIDGLAGGISLFAALTLMFLGVKFDVVFAASLAAILVGSIAGFLPYNLPPAKTYNGSTGDMFQGLLLAVLAIISGSKLSVSIIVLSLPIIDAIWVLWGRYWRHRQEIKSIGDLLHINDQTHLHHRLLALGLSVRQVLALELSIFLIFCSAAYYFAGFSNTLIVAMIIGLVILILFVLIRYLSNSNRVKEKLSSSKKPSAEDLPQTPEEKYAY